MAIGFISDTHGALDDVLKALELLSDCEAIIHLGDILNHGPRNKLPEGYDTIELTKVLSERDNIYYVKGNCDCDADIMVTGKDISSKLGLFKFDGLRIYAVHGYEETLEERVNAAKFYVSDVVAFGHTHKKVLDVFEGILILNPGSTSIPKDGIKSVAKIKDGKAMLIALDTGEILSEIDMTTIDKEGVIKEENFFVGELF